MLESEQAKRGLTEREIADRYGWSQQTFNTWKRGVVPRPKMYSQLAKFLRISTEDLKVLATEALSASGNTKLPDMGSPIIGRETAPGVLLFDEAIGMAKPVVKGCYAVRIGGKHMWVNKNLRPADGNTVVIRKADGIGELAVWPVETEFPVHVVVLQEMV